MSPNDLNDTFDLFYLLATFDIISIASRVWRSFHHDLRYISFDVEPLKTAQHGLKSIRWFSCGVKKPSHLLNYFKKMNDVLCVLRRKIYTLNLCQDCFYVMRWQAVIFAMHEGNNDIEYSIPFLRMHGWIFKCKECVPIHTAYIFACRDNVRTGRYYNFKTLSILSKLKRIYF